MRDGRVVKPDLGANTRNPDIHIGAKFPVEQANVVCLVCEIQAFTV